MPAKKTAKKPAKGTLTAEERAAMKEYIQEKKSQAAGADGEKMLLAKVAQMKEPDRSMAKRIHEIVKAAAPGLMASTWYGMPAWKNGEKTVCFFQDAAKFKARYATLGFSDQAKIDDGTFWPTSYALSKLTPDVEAKITALVKKAVS